LPVALAKKLLPTLEGVLHINKEQNATVYKASELLENVEPLLDYSYVAEEYDFQLEGRCRRILDQYDTTYKEVIRFRSKAEIDEVDTKTAECLTLLGKKYKRTHFYIDITTYKEESIKAAEEDIDSLQQQRTIEDGRISLGDVEEKEAIGQKLITDENEELKLIQSNCHTDLDIISKNKFIVLMISIPSQKEMYPTTCICDHTNSRLAHVTCFGIVCRK